MVRIAVDAMGGDNAPLCVLEGCREALAAWPQLNILLVGPEAVQAQAREMGLPEDRVSFLNATEVIENCEAPAVAIRRKKDSTIVKGMKAVANGEADGFVSAGSTGAVLAGGIFIIKRIKGVERPALAPVLPTRDGKGVLLIDCGANVDCEPKYLHRFAVMGSAYMALVQKVKDPKVGIVNNGAEDEKGNALVKATFPLLREEKKINFIGSLEARDVLSGDANVAVCDGFVGNMVLKTTEGTAKFIMRELKEALYANLFTKLAALLLKKRLYALKKKMDYSEYGGAPLLGVEAPVVKAHGSSGGHAYACAIAQCMRMAEGKLVDTIRGALAEGEAV